MIVFILLVFYIIKLLNCFQSVKIIDYITIKMIDCIYIKLLNCFQDVKIIDCITIKMIDCIYIIGILDYIKLLNCFQSVKIYFFYLKNYY